jgi:hypothetical protein
MHSRFEWSRFRAQQVPWDKEYSSKDNEFRNPKIKSFGFDYVKIISVLSGIKTLTRKRKLTSNTGEDEVTGSEVRKSV